MSALAIDFARHAQDQDDPEAFLRDLADHAMECIQNGTPTTFAAEGFSFAVRPEKARSVLSAAREALSMYADEGATTQAHQDFSGGYIDT